MNRKPILNLYGYIYMTTNLIDNKRYVGKHKYDKPELDKSYLGSGVILGNAVRKYGKDNFSVEILDWAQSEEELNELEKSYIAQYSAVESEEFYNITDGGESVPINYGNDFAKGNPTRYTTGHSEGYQIHHKPWNAGKKLTDKQKSKVSSAENRKRLSELMTSRLENDTTLGFQKGHKPWNTGLHVDVLKSHEHSKKKVVKFSTDEEFIEIKDSISEALSEFGVVGHDGILKALKDFNRVYKGYKWMYKTEYDSTDK